MLMSKSRYIFKPSRPHHRLLWVIYMYYPKTKYLWKSLPIVYTLHKGLSTSHELFRATMDAVRPVSSAKIALASV